MSELKSIHAFDVYKVYTKTGDDDVAQVYLRPEADTAIKKLKALVIRVFLPKPTADFVEVKPVAPRRFF